MLFEIERFDSSSYIFASNVILTCWETSLRLAPKVYFRELNPAIKAHVFLLLQDYLSDSGFS